ncbi:hypothetical protein ACWDSJ_16640 [Nocardia sp. NPDC003482]
MFNTTKTLLSVGISAVLAAAFTAMGTAPAGADPFPAGTPVLTSDLTPETQQSGHVAVPADDVMHPDSWVEWWYTMLRDPASERTFIAVITSAPVPAVSAVFMYGNGNDLLSAPAGGILPGGGLPVLPPANDGLPGVRTIAGGLDFDPVRGAYHLVLQAPVQADVWLDGAPLPGATGRMTIDDGEWMGWSAPVASSTVHGWVRSPGGERENVDGWRGYHDHNWGHFTMVDQRADGWEWGVSFEPDGGATLLGGLVRRGGQWKGTLVDVRPSGTRACVPTTLQLSDWYSGPTPLSGATFALPATITAACAPPPGLPGAISSRGELYGADAEFTATFHLTESLVADGGVLAASAEAPYRTVPGSFGIFEHVRSLVSRVEQAGRERQDTVVNPEGGQR